MADKLDVEILADGSVKVTSGVVSMVNHSNAEAFLRELARGCGGETTRVRRPDALVGHGHVHGQGEGQHVHSN